MFLCLLTPLAASETPQTFEVKAALDVAGSTRFIGAAEATAAVAGAVIDFESVAEGQALRLTFNEARFRVINFPYFIAGDPGGPLQSNATEPGPEEQISEAGLTGTLRLASPFSKGSYMLLPRSAVGENLRMAIEGTMEFTIFPTATQDPFLSRSHVGFMVGEGPRPLVVPAPAGVFTQQSGPERTLKGDMVTVLHGGVFRFEGNDGQKTDIWTGERLNQTRTLADPKGTAGMWWYDRIVILLEGDAVVAHFSGPAANPWRTAVVSAEGRWIGDLGFAGATGQIDIDGAPFPPDPKFFQTIGNFSGQTDYTGETGNWNIEGPATFVGINGLPVVGDREAHEWTTAAVVAGSLSLLALVAAYFTHLGRELLTFISGRNVAKPLESAARLQFLREIAHQPGLTLRDLAARAGLTKWGALHHMAILKRARFVDEVRNGNVSTFMLNSHSYKFYAPALASSDKGDKHGKVFVAGALAELNHPSRRMIFEALQRTGPAHYAQLVAAWKAIGIAPPYPSPRDLTYHASKMEEAGLVWRRRDGPNVVWALNLDVDAVRQHQRRAYLRDPAATAIVEVLTSRPSLTLDQLLREVSASSRLHSRDAIRQSLLSLEQVGVVRLNGLTYALVEGAGPGPQTT